MFISLRGLSKKLYQIYLIKFKQALRETFNKINIFDF